MFAGNITPNEVLLMMSFAIGLIGYIERKIRSL